VLSASSLLEEEPPQPLAINIVAVSAENPTKRLVRKGFMFILLGIIFPKYIKVFKKNPVMGTGTEFHYLGI
jgi:hypothetical protein